MMPSVPSPHGFSSSLRKLSAAAAGSLLALVVGLAPALALDSGWAETEGGRMRLVVDPAPRDDGTLHAVLDIDLAPGWKTYWRDPGGAGIPPMLDLSQSEGLSLETMDYPAPVRVDDGSTVWAGYTAPVRFPLTLIRSAGGTVTLRASAFIGICEKMCVPFQAMFELPLPEDAVASPQEQVLIDEAFAELPEPAAEDFRLEGASFDAGTKELAISASLPGFRPAGTAPELFVAGPAGFAFAPPKLIGDDGGSARWTIRVEVVPKSIAAEDKVPLEFVVTLGPRAVAQSIPVAGFSR
ncbi:protein-disulfide reductase DsbD domain-containing protein [Hoeflea olei]|uniref:Thiol:disulfide interchange protein DsbD N-terminal domain-containing protein n=1 Tax=Hoeflea olei TaxID=1480615 RepID=A0A1C1YQ51_9HYPH|nr:protein-disulfide reductase DsbD domain-containing protein [Hoeflea olei]OCW55629.1 hypothetical protein AWJ14_06485 [Hoeflea olei]